MVGLKKGPVRTVTSKVSTVTSKSLYQARPRTVSFSAGKKVLLTFRVEEHMVRVDDQER